MTFEDALTSLRLRFHMRRVDWRSTIGWPPGSEFILQFWPSGVVTKWEPTQADVLSCDWVRATGGKA